MDKQNSMAARGATWARPSARVTRSRLAKFAAAVLIGAGLVPAIGAAPVAANGYDPATDPYSMKAVTEITGATAFWDQGYTGAGIDVAVIDTGVAPVEGLATPGKIIHGPDLSLDSPAANLRNLDTNGHGTIMAGLIAGKDSALTAPYSAAPASAYRGIAPDARIVSVKVGAADGAVDVSQVIAGIYWVIAHANDPGLNIRVISLSYGTNSTHAYEVDPLAYAAEQAWKAGIVVVAAGGNAGYQSRTGTLASPAFGRNIIAVGSADTYGTPTLADDGVAWFSPWSARGAVRAVDVVSPGTHLQGLRVANGYIDVNSPAGRRGDRYFRGSGTSQSTAIVAGAAALILQKHPGATPDQVKRMLTSTAKTILGNSKGYGAGEIRLATAAGAALPAFTQAWPWSSGTGSLERSRGTDHLTNNGVTLSGEQDIFGKPFSSAAIAAAEAAGSTWSGGDWNGSTWSGSTWSGSTWSGSTWSGSTWSGSTWSGSTWSGSTWSGSTWSGSTWSGGNWATAGWG